MLADGQMAQKYWIFSFRLRNLMYNLAPKRCAWYFICKLCIFFFFFSFFFSIPGPDKTDTHAQPIWYVFTGILSQHILGFFLSSNFNIYCISLPHTVINLSGLVYIWKLENVNLEQDSANFKSSGNMK